MPIENHSWRLLSFIRLLIMKDCIGNRYWTIYKKYRTVYIWLSVIMLTFLFDFVNFWEKCRIFHCLMNSVFWFEDLFSFSSNWIFIFCTWVRLELVMDIFVKKLITVWIEAMDSFVFHHHRFILILRMERVCYVQLCGHQEPVRKCSSQIELYSILQEFALGIPFCILNRISLNYFNNQVTMTTITTTT